MTIHRARIQIFSSVVGITPSGQEEMATNNREALQLQISCKPLDWQLSALAQVLNSLLSSFTTLECLEIVKIGKAKSRPSNGKKVYTHSPL